MAARRKTALAALDAALEGATNHEVLDLVTRVHEELAERCARVAELVLVYDDEDEDCFEWEDPEPRVAEGVDAGALMQAYTFVSRAAKSMPAGMSDRGRSEAAWVPS